MELLLKIFRVVFHLQESQRIEDVFQKSSGMFPFSAGIKPLDGDEYDPHEAAVNEGEGQGENKNDQLVEFKPQHLDGFAQVLGEAFV